MGQRLALVEELVKRLTSIRREDGYHTDAGELVAFGEKPELGEDDPDVAIVLVLGDVENGWQRGGKASLVQLPIEIAALAKASLKTPGMTAELVLEDVRTAIETEDRTFAGTLSDPPEKGPVRTIAREPGTTTVGVSVSYTATLKEGWGLV